jgi:DNA-binding CsgD family transcriptional regulator
MISPVLIGRDEQLDALDGMCDSARAGHGQVALIAGEAGVGKSRLAAEAQARAERQGLYALKARCFEPDHVLPFAPLLDLLRQLLAAPAFTPVAEAIGPAAPYLAGLLPELAALLPQDTRAPMLDPEQERRRATHALAQVFVRLASPQGDRNPAQLLLVVEDLHWCDEASLDVLLALARRAAALPLLLLATYRSDETPPALAQTLAALEPERLAQEIQLAPLNYAEVDALLRAIFRQQRPIRGDFLAELYALTEGNPFFIEELLKSLVAAGEIFYARGGWDRKPLGELHIPRSVQVAVNQRAAGPSAGARRVLTLAAVAGRRFDFGLLRRLTGHDEATLLDLVKELIAVQLVVEESSETFAFRHALTREALYAGLLARERRSLHGAIAAALAGAGAPGGQPGDAGVEDLAYHAFAAGAWPEALVYARRAAERAQRLYAPRAAVEHLSRAITAEERLGLSPSSELRGARGRMHESLGAFDPARADYQAALASARASGNQAAECRALLDLGFLWAERDYAQMGEHRRQALDLARALGDPALLGASLNRVGNWHLFAEQPRVAHHYHREALDLFQAAGDRRGLAATHDLLGVTHILGDDVPASVAHYEQAIALFREFGDLQGLSSSLAFCSMRGASALWVATAWPVVEAAACVRDGEEALRIARQIGWRAGEAGALTCLACGHGPRGAYAQALAGAGTALEIAQDIENSAWAIGARIALGACALDLYALDMARDHLERALAAAQSLGAFFVRNAAGYLALVLIAQRELERAAHLLDATLAPDAPMETQGQRVAWCARAELALGAGDPQAALAVVDRLIASALHVEHFGAGCIPRLWQVRGAALAVLGRLEEAEGALLAADLGAAQRGLLPARWRILAALGRLSQRQARRRRAEAAFEEARAIVEQLAAALPEPGLREGFLGVALALLPRPHAPTPRRAAKAAAGGLTERERTIAALVAQHRSNREIAETLVVGERTVETHVTNILAKLGFISRRQIIAWVEEKGLAPRGE